MKIFNLENLLEKIPEKKINGNIIGFTNGCFDLLHEGHLKLIREARGKCDFLIIGLNSDSSVKKLKGPRRPIESIKIRLLKLTSMSEIDSIIVYDELTPERIIHQIKPDILFKGDDYRKEDIVGYNFITSYGGKIELIERIKGQSTTEIISRMKI